MSWSIPPEKPHCHSNDGNIHRTRSLKQDATGVSCAVPSREFHHNQTSILVSGLTLGGQRIYGFHYILDPLQSMLK